jgi:hypothetical protein
MPVIPLAGNKILDKTGERRKAEIRRSKSEGNPKIETRNPKGWLHVSAESTEKLEGAKINRGIR